MSAEKILRALGHFTPAEIALFEQYAIPKKLGKNEILLKPGAVCPSVYYILSGAFFQYQEQDIAEVIIDLHLPGEWLFNHQSLLAQTPSVTAIRAFASSEILELRLPHLHYLISRSPAFLQLNRVFLQPFARTHLFDNALSPKEKYNYIKDKKPLLVQTFPVKMIASYLKIAPETLSRVRAKY